MSLEPGSPHDIESPSLSGLVSHVTSVDQPSHLVLSLAVSLLLVALRTDKLDLALDSRGFGCWHLLDVQAADLLDLSDLALDVPLVQVKLPDQPL